MPSIEHFPLENQEVTLTPGQEIPVEINSGPKNYEMLEQNPNISHLQPGSHLEIVEEEMNLTGPEVILAQIPSNFPIKSISERHCGGRGVPQCLRPDNIDAPKALKAISLLFVQMILFITLIYQVNRY